MTCRTADQLILTRLGWSRESDAGVTSGCQLDLPINIRLIVIIEHISDSGSRFHDDKIMYHSAIIRGVDRDLLPGGYDEIGRLELKIGQGHIDGRSGFCRTTGGKSQRHD